MKLYALLALLALTSCGTSPEPDYYALAPVNGTVQPDIALPLMIERPALAAYLDRPDFVRQDSNYRFSIDEFQRWDEPLDRMFENNLTQDLRQRLPSSGILSEADTGGFKMRYRIESDIQQFNLAGNQAVLKVTLALIDTTVAVKPATDKNTTPVKLQVMQQETFMLGIPSGSSPQQIAASLSQLVGAYADRITLLLKQQMPIFHSK